MATTLFIPLTARLAVTAHLCTNLALYRHLRGRPSPAPASSGQMVYARTKQDFDMALQASSCNAISVFQISSKTDRSSSLSIQELPQHVTEQL
jgi:hypothetical protein